MADSLTTARNHFYRKVTPNADVGINAAYSDLTAGSAATATIKTGPDYSIFLAKELTPDAPPYGAGELSEVWSNFYVNNYKTENSVLPAVVKVYGVNDSAIIEEGGMVLNVDVAASGNRLDTFVSYLDYSTPWMEENFDGVNKGYGDVEMYTKQVMSSPEAEQFVVRWQYWMDLLQGEGRMTNWNALVGALANPTVAGKLDQGNGLGLGFEGGSNDELVRLKKVSSGKKAGQYKIPVDGMKDYYGGFGFGWGFTDEDDTTFPLSTWLKYGAEGISHTNVKTYNQFDTEFVDTVTQHNSIFTFVRESRDIEDIKVQTVGTAGDDDKFYTYSRITLDPKEKISGENSCHMMNFWENYSGSADRKVDDDGTYPMPFGYTNTISTPRTPYPQFNVAVMDHLPIPIGLDIAALSGSNLSGLTDSATSQYMEIPLLFEKMPQVLKSVDSTPKLTFDRGFWIIFGNKPPTVEDNFNSYITSLRDSPENSGFGWCGLWFFYEKEGDEDIQVISFNDKISTTSPFATSASDSIKLHSTQTSSAAFPDANKTTIGVNEWQTLRIKFKAGQIPDDNGKLLAYFPTALDSEGAMKSVEIDMKNSDEGAEADIWNLKTMSLWCNNFRAVFANGSTTGDGTASNSINYNLSADPIGFNTQDKYVSVLIDAIRLYGYNNTVKNSSVNFNNGNRNVTLPSSVTYPPCSGNVFGTSGGTHADNYYLGNNALGQINLCVGVDGYIQSLATKNPYKDDVTFFLMNNFTTGDEQSIKPLPNKMFKLNTLYSSSGDVVGNISQASVNSLYNAGDFLGADGYGADIITRLFMKGGTYFNNNFSQKGLFAISGLNTATAGINKRENPYVAARVLQVSSDGNEIVVDNPTIFDLPTGHPNDGGSEYVVWLNSPPDAYDISTYKDRTLEAAQEGTGSIGFGFGTPNGYSAGGKNALPLFQTKPRVGSTITLNRGITVDDRNESSMATTTLSGANMADAPYLNRANINQIMIGPKKFWFNILFMNASGTTLGGNNMQHFGSGYFPLAGDVYPDTSFTQSLGPTLGYGPMAPVISTSVAFTTLGTTFNEYRAVDGAYNNRWNLIPNGDSIVDVNTDYGYGTYGEATDEVPEIFGGYINKAPVISGANYIKLKNYVKENSPEFSSVFNYGLYPFEHRTSLQDNYLININTKDASSNKVGSIWGLYDAPPKRPNLEVKGAVDFLGLQQTGRIGASADIDIYSAAKGDLANNVKFTWKEEDDDIWYRLLFVDNTLISNKYHTINFWAPLNENSTTHGYYTSAKDTVATNFSGTVTQDIEGFCGWGAKFDGASLLSSSAIIDTLGDTGEFTFIAHTIPSSISGTIFQASASAAVETIRVGLSGNKVVGYLNNEGARVVSRTSYECDGLEPVVIIMTYNRDLLDNNLKLYVNNRLEDTADYTTSYITSGTVSIGGKWKPLDDYFTGFIEEITFHKKAAYVPTNAGEYNLNTSLLPDVSGNNSLFYQGKLFLMDYHNVRGKSTNDVCESNLAGWKATGLT